MRFAIPPIRPRPRAFLLMDAVWGITLALALLMLMTVVVARQQRAQKQLAAARQRNRAAESALLALQAGQALPPGASVERLPAEAPAGHAWVRLSLSDQSGAARSDLIGLVPAAAIQGGVQ